MAWLLLFPISAVYYFLIKKVKFFSFEGRISRSNYWKIYLFYTVCLFVYFFLLQSFAETFFGFGYRQSGPTILILGMLFYRMLRVPIDVRRCHDLNYSGWHSIMLFIPAVNLIFLLGNFTKKGNESENAYGKNPLLDE